VLDMLQKGQLDANTAKLLLGGKLPGSSPNMPEGLPKASDRKRPLEPTPTSTDHAGGGDGDDTEFDKSLDDLLQQSRQSKLDTLGLKHIFFDNRFYLYVG